MTQTVAVRRDDGVLTIAVAGVAVICCPASFVPSLAAATHEMFNDYRVSGNRIHWAQLGFSLLFVHPSSR